MGHTKADTNLIKECSRALSRIHREFDKHGNPAGDFKMNSAMVASGMYSMNFLTLGKIPAEN
ncbi:hypothetical protein ABZU86_10335 [Streptomyces sp. NPDC005271]|uniref:hypothetical protein n=1 Tax=unclassified Streptomyces TaxID=2593676 RepID=UPI0033A76822